MFAKTVLLEIVLLVAMAAIVSEASQSGKRPSWCDLSKFDFCNLTVTHRFTYSDGCRECTCTRTGEHEVSKSCTGYCDYPINEVGSVDYCEKQVGIIKFHARQCTPVENICTNRPEFVYRAFGEHDCNECTCKEGRWEWRGKCTLIYCPPKLQPTRPDSSSRGVPYGYTLCKLYLEKLEVQGENYDLKKKLERIQSRRYRDRGSPRRNTWGYKPINERYSYQ